MNDYLIDNLDDNIIKKKIKSGQKGKRGERYIVDILNKRFSKFISENNVGEFSRSIGSGNRWGQNVKLSPTASQVYSGDLTCPDNFKFVIESKSGYNDIDLMAMFSNKCPGLDEFLKQTEDEAGRTGRKPLLVWKKDRKPAVAFVKDVDVPGILVNPSIIYHDWVGLSLEMLLSKTCDEFWFSTIQSEPNAG